MSFNRYVVISHADTIMCSAVSDVNAAEYRVVHERYISLRPRIITALVSIDKVKQAYELAERHRDFRSLVGLCNDPVHGSTTRIRSLMEKYGEEFAFALYHFYVEKGERSPPSFLSSALLTR